MPVARVVQLASHLEQKRLAEIAYETRRFVRIGESEETINQRIADKSQPILKIYHYHCNHLGTPQELSDDKGDIIWLSYDRAWGGSFDSLYKQQFVDNFAVTENELQPFKFQGQSLDTETGLHYNRFRYYDSDVGMFVSRDPIGLMGGDNTFQYAPNPIEWIDPLGLNNCKPSLVRYKKDKITPISGSYQSGINRAWALEKELVELTGHGTVEWTDSQKQELKSKGRVKGYTGHHINNAASAPLWQGDPRNIVFLTNTPNGGDHLGKNGSNLGHRGTFQNKTTGRLIDRQEMMRQWKKNQNCEK